jgi:adapter protein MecA 1/2
VIVTQLPSLAGMDAGAHEDDELDDEPMMTSDPFGAFTFVFQDFEDVIRAAHSLCEYTGIGGTLYHYKNRYHLFFEEEEVEEGVYDTIWSILHEYGELSSTTKAMLDEYGKRVMNGNAIETLTTHFPLRT